MKRVLSILMMMALSVVLFISTVSALKPGEPMGNVLFTDIVAYIDGYPIRSYNIEGNTYIVVEDLIQYGFQVTWDSSNQKLVISPDHTIDYTTTYKPTNVSGTVGEIAMQYLYTNISTWIGDAMIISYNIGGMTCIQFDILAQYFSKDLVWNGDSRSISMLTDDAAKICEQLGHTSPLEIYLSDVSCIRCGLYFRKQIPQDILDMYTEIDETRKAVIPYWNSFIDYLLAGNNKIIEGMELGGTYTAALYAEYAQEYYKKLVQKFWRQLYPAAITLVLILFAQCYLIYMLICGKLLIVRLPIKM